MTQSQESMLFWRDDALLTAAGEVIATVNADVIEFGEQRLLVESSLGTLIGFRVRATATHGAVFTMQKQSVTVSRLEAQCESRHYTLTRTSPWRKVREIRDSAGTHVATVRAHVNGVLAMEVLQEDLPLVDIVFLSFGCLLVDATIQNVRI